MTTTDIIIHCSVCGVAVLRLMVRHRNIEWMDPLGCVVALCEKHVNQSPKQQLANSKTKEM